MTEIDLAGSLTDGLGKKLGAKFTNQVPAISHVERIEVDLIEAVPVLDNFAPSVPRPVFLKQIKQAVLMEGLTRLLADIYGDRSQSPITLADILIAQGIPDHVVQALVLTQGQPVANKLLDRLSHPPGPDRRGAKAISNIEAALRSYRGAAQKRDRDRCHCRTDYKGRTASIYNDALPTGI